MKYFDNKCLIWFNDGITTNHLSLIHHSFPHYCLHNPETETTTGDGRTHTMCNRFGMFNRRWDSEHLWMIRGYYVMLILLKSLGLYHMGLPFILMKLKVTMENPHSKIIFPLTQPFTSAVPLTPESIWWDSTTSSRWSIQGATGCNMKKTDQTGQASGHGPFESHNLQDQFFLGLPSGNLT